jgi:molybdenum cofactor cytidylyltransferase
MVTSMQLSHALRMDSREVVVLVGGGGKTTLMFRLADELVASGRRVVTTMTTRIFVGQMARAPARLVTEDEATLLAELPATLAAHRHVIVAGDVIVEQDKVQGVSPALLDRIAAQPAVDALIVEADGSRRLPFKAPAPHEPVIPASATVVVPIVGLDVLGQPLDAGHVHRPEIVAELTGAALGDPVTPAMIAAVLAHLRGGAKGVPPHARLIPFLNKAEDEATLAAAPEIARLLLKQPRIDSVLIGAAQADDPVREVWGRVGAVVLAAGEAKRFGALKQVLPWRGMPLVAHVADQALRCPDIDRVAVTVGAGAEQVQETLADRDVRVVPVPDWAEGQSRSVLAGLKALIDSPDITPHPPSLTGKGEISAPLLRGEGMGERFSAILFLLADQPGVSPELLSVLIQRHRETLAPIVAPRHAGQRGNPVLFDRAIFPEFDQLQGDIGARPIIQAHRDAIAWVDWPTPEILQDIDIAADYDPSAQG